MKCRRTSNPISSSSFSLRSAANISFILLLSITSLFPPPANCQLLGSLMSMRGLGSLNPFAGLSSGLSGGGLLSSLRGGGGGSSSLFGSLTGSSSSIPGVGTGSMMSSFAPDIGSGSMNYGQQIPMLTQVELAEIMAQQSQPSYGHGFADAEHAQAPPMQQRPPRNQGQNQPRPSPSAPHASEEERDYDVPKDRGNQRGPPRGGRGGYGPGPQSSEESERPSPSHRGNRGPPSNNYGNGPRGNSNDNSYESEERPPSRGPPRGGRQSSNYNQGGGSSGSESSYEEQPYDTPAPASNYNTNSYRQPVADDGEEDESGDGGYGSSGSGSTPVSAAGGYDYPPTAHSHQTHRYNAPSRNYHQQNGNNPPRSRVHQYSYAGNDGRGSDHHDGVTSPSSQSYRSPPSEQNYRTEESSDNGENMRGAGGRQRYQLNEPSSYYHSTMHNPRPVPANNNMYYRSPTSNDGRGDGHYNHYENNNDEGVDDEGASSDDSPSSSPYYNPVPNAGPGLPGYQPYSSPHSDYYNEDDDDEQPSGTSNVHFPERRHYY